MRDSTVYAGKKCGGWVLVTLINASQLCAWQKQKEKCEVQNETT